VIFFRKKGYIGGHHDREQRALDEHLAKKALKSKRVPKKRA